MPPPPAIMNGTRAWYTLRFYNGFSLGPGHRNVFEIQVIAKGKRGYFYGLYFKRVILQFKAIVSNEFYFLLRNLLQKLCLFFWSKRTKKQSKCSRLYRQFEEPNYRYPKPEQQLFSDFILLESESTVLIRGLSAS